MLSVGVQFHGTWAELTDSDREKILDAMVSAGVTWVRIDLGWSMVEPKAKGAFDTAWAVPFIERVMKMAHARGLKILATFWRTPTWAGGKTAATVFPTSNDDYCRALAWCAKRFTEWVDAWEIWNEPNASEFLSPPDPVKYAGLLKAGYQGVKAGDPTALVVFGGPMFVDTAWIAKVYAAGAKPYFDVMAVHPYQGNAAMPPDAPSKGMRERLTNTDSLIALMAKEGDSHKPIWFTEFGWSTHANAADTPVWFLGVSEADQAKYMGASLALIEQRYPQVTHAFWYTSRDLETGRVHQDNRGLIRKDFSPKPALTAVRKFTAPKVVQVTASDHSRGE